MGAYDNLKAYLNNFISHGLDAMTYVAHTSIAQRQTVQDELTALLNAAPSSGNVFLTENSSDPDDPAEGQSVIWQSDGTGAGDDGDIMLKITAAGTTKTITLVDFSAF